MASFVHEHDVIEIIYLQVRRAVQRRTQHFAQSCGGVFRESGHALANVGQRGPKARECLERRNAADPVVSLGQEHVERSIVVEVSIVRQQRTLGAGVVLRVASPARRDDVEATVSVQITGGDAVPAAGQLTEPVRSRSFDEAALPVEKNAEITPLGSEKEIGVAIAVYIGEERG